jgi:hypothetical protein
MRLEPVVVRAVAKEVAAAAAGVIQDYRAELVAEEPDITGRLLGAIRDRFRSREIRGIVWNGKTLRSKQGVGNEEQRYGADFMGVLDISLPTFSVKKGFLAQAKRAEPGAQFSANRWHDLVEQCNAMLRVTPAAFVCIYSTKRGVRFVPAVDVVHSKTKDLFTHYNRSIQSFFELFLECFVGDGRLDTADIQVLDVLADHPVSNVLTLIARRPTQ